MKLILVVIMAVMLNLGIPFLISVWVYNKVLNAGAPEYVALMFSISIFFVGVITSNLKKNHV